MESGDSGSTGSSSHKNPHKHHSKDEHIHFNEEDVKGHEEGHVIHEADTHFVVRRTNFQKGSTQEGEEEADPEVQEHLKVARANSLGNKGHQAEQADEEMGEQGGQ